MSSALKKLWCSHELFWSERHQTERCRKCGTLVATSPNDRNDLPRRAPQRVEGAEPAPLIALQTVLDERPDSLDPSAANADRPVVPPAPKILPPPQADNLPAGAAARRKTLPSYFARLANGEELGKLEVLDLVMGLLEDAHVHEPVIFGPEAASRFAELQLASANEWLCWPGAATERRSA